jgi:SAM-dependent methyltransferase
MANLLARAKTRFWLLSMTGLTRGPHITRYFMYDHMRELAESLPNREGDVLSVSDSTRLCSVMHVNAKSLVEADYPDHNLLALQFPDASFDFVLCDQVLEHVEGSPQQAVDEIWRVLRPGGVAVITSCFVYRLHNAPGDFWRFSPDGLRLLAGRFSRILDNGGWGNFKASRLLLTDMRFEGLPRTKWHPLHRVAVKNDPDWPILTWVVAQK